MRFSQLRPAWRAGPLLATILSIAPLTIGCGSVEDLPQLKKEKPEEDETFTVADLPSPWNQTLVSCDIYPHLAYNRHTHKCFTGPDRFYYTTCKKERCRAVRLRVHNLIDPLTWERDLRDDEKGTLDSVHITATPLPGGRADNTSSPAVKAIPHSAKVTRHYFPTQYQASEEEILFVNAFERYCFEAKIVRSDGSITALSDRLCSDVGSDTSIWYGELYVEWQEE